MSRMEEEAYSYKRDTNVNGVAYFIVFFHNTNSIPTICTTICHVPSALLPQNSSSVS